MRQKLISVVALTLACLIGYATSTADGQPAGAQGDAAAQYGGVRVFTGHAVSESENFKGARYPAVMVVLEGQDKKILKGYFTFFVGSPITHVVHRQDIEVMEEGTSFKGGSRDPRGFNVQWQMRLDERRVKGSYDQPNDHGLIRLNEVEEDEAE